MAMDCCTGPASRARHGARSRGAAGAARRTHASTRSFVVSGWMQRQEKKSLSWGLQLPTAPGDATGDPEDGARNDPAPKSQPPCWASVGYPQARRRLRTDRDAHLSMRRPRGLARLVPEATALIGAGADRLRRRNPSGEALHDEPVKRRVDPALTQLETKSPRIGPLASRRRNSQGRRPPRKICRRKQSFLSA